MIPKYVPAIVPMADIIAGLDIGQYLAIREQQGATLVVMMPMLSHLLIVHRVTVPQEAQGELRQPESDDGLGPDDQDLTAAKLAA